MRAFAGVPPVILPPARRRSLHVDLLPVGLTDVADPKIAGGSVERVAPRVSEAVRPDLGARAGPVVKRVVGRHAVGVVARRTRIDPEHLPKQGAEVLGVPLRIAGAAAVTEADVEEAVGPERQVASVVVRERLLYQQHPAK